MSTLKPPDLWPPIGLSREEREATITLHVVVDSLRHYAESFAAALELYRFSRSKPANVEFGLAWKWQWIAINEGAMQVWFLREALGLIPHKFRACPSASRHLDQDAVQRSLDLFDARFPEYKRVRDAVAHAPTISLTMHRHAPPDGLYPGPQIKDGDTFELVNHGVRYQLAMTDETLRKMVEVVTHFWREFAPVEKAFDQAGRSDG